jgi:hypothetical protein
MAHLADLDVLVSFGNTAVWGLFRLDHLGTASNQGLQLIILTHPMLMVSKV